MRTDGFAWGSRPGLEAEPKRVAQDLRTISKGGGAVHRGLDFSRRRHRFTSLLHRRNLRHPSDCRDGVVCGSGLHGARIFAGANLRPYATKGPQYVDSPVGDDGRLLDIADGGVGSVRRASPGTGPFLQAIVDHSSDGGYGDPGISETTSNGSPVASSAALVAAES